MKIMSRGGKSACRKKPGLFAAALCASLLSAFSLGGCAGALPGGKDTVNASFYKGGDELNQLCSELWPGMTRDQVFRTLGRAEQDFTRLDRKEIVGALFGGQDAILPGTPEEQVAYLKSIMGYKLEYKIVKRRHGFTSPITIRTDTAGFDYSMTLLFRNGKLLEKPVVSGGLVDGKNSKTLFDYLNPGLILSGR